MITAIVLTYNEARHIERCLASLRPAVSRTVVVDSHSNDCTRELATSLGAEVFVNAWVNHATQFNWALENAGLTTPWIIRLDADEVLTSELAERLPELCSAASEDVHGFTVNRQIHFLGRFIRHGGIYPIEMLRVFRRGRGRVEQRWMDEHIVVKGRVEHIDLDIIDRNTNDLTWWIEKHNKYASREVIDILLKETGKADDTARNLSGRTGIKRFLKEAVYLRLPLGVRSALYFIYRYFLRLGFLDGRQGLVFHFLQGFWYRFLVDAKLMEIRMLMKAEDIDRIHAIERMFGKRIE